MIILVARFSNCLLKRKKTLETSTVLKHEQSITNIIFGLEKSFSFYEMLDSKFVPIVAFLSGYISAEIIISYVNLDHVADRTSFVLPCLSVYMLFVSFISYSFFMLYRRKHRSFNLI